MAGVQTVTGALWRRVQWWGSTCAKSAKPVKSRNATAMREYSRAGCGIRRRGRGSAGEEALGVARAEARRRGRSDIGFSVADAHALPFPDDTFDVVHAHQVLQHVGDPVLALREMRRVCRPGGIVAVRDSDYAAFTWFPEIPELDEWLDLYRRVARACGGEPDAGRRLLSWAHTAGFTDVSATSSTWCFATPEDRAWWGGMWAERVLKSDMARLALASGGATEGDLRRLSEGWRAWAGERDGWLSLLHGELICRV